MCICFTLPMKIFSNFYISGWGKKFSGLRANVLARIFGLKYIIKEDGFLRSIGRNDEPLSKLYDYCAAHYCAYERTYLDQLILNTLTHDQINRSLNILSIFKSNSVSKYNSEREFNGTLPNSYILLIDQVYGDLSVKYGFANKNSFNEMLACALSKDTNQRVIIKVHPDVYSRKKRGYYDIKELEENPRIQIVAENCHPVRLICEADAVYTVTSQVGFEALIWGKKVKCFGMPFYAGWGLTEDALSAPKRRMNISLEQLVHAALVKYPIYRDPETNEKTTVEKIIKYVGFQRQMRFRFPKTLYAYGFTPWKKSILKSFTQGSELIFVKQLKSVPSNSIVLVWGSQNCDGLDESVNLIRVEDGFLRSVGLGGDLIRPQSWVFDNEGIYYDSSNPSQLETILNNTEFKSEELVRAKYLIEKLIEHRISKYNLGDSQLEIKNGEKTTILVVGQGEKDASIRFGTGEVNTNLKLLKAVREKFPAAYIVYKPHPDVVAGIRRKGESESLEKNYYDQIVKLGDALSLFDSVDSVHTMTSLVGFEALLRKKKVYTYGQPFYAGWGLTIDAMPIKRRNRQLSLEELVVGSLIRYPTYISSTSKMYTSPERTVEELIQLKEKGVQRMPVWRKFVRDLIKIWTHSKLRPNA